jgi:hypothetical protein
MPPDPNKRVYGGAFGEMDKLELMMKQQHKRCDLSKGRAALIVKVFFEQVTAARCIG